MEHNTELEEGEACYYKDGDDDNIDLDSLSYIDERIQNLLGHFQKDFEGGVSAENLGSKFGGYGSFLPTYERSPCSRAHPKTPQTNHSSPKSPINLHKEAVPHTRKPLSKMHPSARIGNASHSLHLVHDLRAASVDDSMKKDRGIFSNDVAKRCSLKDDATTIKTGSSTDQRSLKFRLKMKPNILPQKNAEIYSGLGLDDSPSSSMGNSPIESEGTPPVSKEKAEDSPTHIVQVTFSHTIPGRVLISPLHQSLLLSMEKKKAIGDSRYISSLNGHQEPCSMSTDESDSFVGNGHLKKRTVRIVRQSEKLLEKKHMNGTVSESDMTLQTKKRLGNRTPDRKDFLSNDLRWTPLSSSICDAGETAEGTAKASEVSKEANENGVQGRVVSVEALKEESLESISGQDFKKIEKRNARNGFMKNVVEVKQEISQKDSSTDPKNNGKCNTGMISKKVERDAMKFKIDKMYETPPKVKIVSEGKNKSKGDQSPGKSETVVREDSFGGTNNALVTNKGSAGFGTTSRNKVIKTKSLKDNKIRDSTKNSLKEKNSEQRVDDRHSNRAIKNANINNEKQATIGAKVKERPSSNKVGNQLLAESFMKDAPDSFPMAENNLAPEMIPSEVAAPQLIAEDWVCCDSCQTWRLLPTGIKPDQLPEKWLCSMLDWLPGMNSCHFSEDETTNALHALYQIPVSEGQNNMQTHVTETAFGVSSNDALQFVLNHKKSSSGVSLDCKKKKRLIKEKGMSEVDYDIPQLSNSAKINAQVSRKNRTLNDTNQHPADSNPMKKTSSKQSSRFSIAEDNSVSEEKEKQITGGDRKHIKLKRKTDADQYRLGTPKRPKTEYSYADKQLDPGMGLEKVVPNSRNGLPTKADRKDMRKYDEYCLPEDVTVKDRLLVPVKKEGVQAQVSSGGGSLDVKNSCKNDGLTKKRKSKDWLGDEKHNSSYSLHDDKPYDEEGNVNKFRKENKSTVLNKEAKPVAEGGGKLSKGGVSQVCLPGSRDQMAVGSDVRYGSDQSRKHRKIIASHQALDGIDPLRKDFSSGQLAFAATSSSSKVSGSHKARTNFDDVKGSPVESVTSSPLRASNLDNRILAASEISIKGDASKGTTISFSSKSSRRGADNREGQLSVKLREGRISYNAPPASHKDNARVEEVKDKAGVQAKTFKMKNNHLLEDSVPVEEHGNCANVMNHEEKVNKGSQESELSRKKSDKVTSLHSMEKNRRSNSQVYTDNMKILASENSYSKKAISQQNLTQDVEEVNKANPACTELRDKKSKALSSSVSEIKKETLIVPPYQKGDMSSANPVHDGNNGFAPDKQLSVPSPVRTNAGQTAIDTLEEATKLKDRADHFKNSGFDFESNETYFEAGLKFMHGASLLESCHSEISKHGEMSQMQIYATGAKLFKSCAHGYESRQEKAAAALAYKCMQVAYMRVVYCKHSSASRDRHELQATLQMVSQGDSPSSSASDLDNLNNQVAMDKATLPKGTNALVPSNQVISARTRPSLVRLLDFTQDMNFAMEASTKCQSAFTAANAMMDQARNRDCVTSIKRVIDFSFQDIEELVRLVRNALTAISRAGLRGARE